MTTALVDGDTLYCKACDSYKVKTDFHKDASSKRGYTYYCKECANSRSRKWTAENGHKPEYRASKWGAYYKHKYGLSLEDRIGLLREQDNACAICRVPLNPHGTHTHTDHCHTTGKIRGILCTNCNRGLGHFKDSIDNLKEAIKYLEGNK